jgi:tetratricopeptide (TPR) repeat protein
MSSSTKPDVVRLLKQGLNHYGLGDLEAAISAWEEAQRLDPDHQAVRDYLETAYEEAGGPPQRSADAGATSSAPAPNGPIEDDDDTPRSFPELEAPSPIAGLQDSEPEADSPPPLDLELDPEPDTLVRGALDAYREGRLAQAYQELDRAADLEPDRLDLRAYQELIRNQLMGQWAREIGDQGRVAHLKVEINELMDRDLQPDEGFLVSQIDGSVTIGDLINVSALDRFRTFEILARLIRDGIVE